MKNSTLYLITALSLTLLAGCGGSGKTTIQFLAGGKPVVYANKGEVVEWIGADGKALKVKFPVSSPCQEGSLTSTCTTQMEGAFPYDCTGCSDPGIVVGSDNGGLHGQMKKTMASNAVANAQLGYIYCDTTTKAAKVYPDPLVAAASTASGVSTVQWVPIGDSGITNYTVTLPTGNTCVEGMTINQMQDVCTLVVGAASTPYTVTADVCMTPGTETLTIQ